VLSKNKVFNNGIVKYTEIALNNENKIDIIIEAKMYFLYFPIYLTNLK